jgi:hypothetical protein
LQEAGMGKMKEFSNVASAVGYESRAASKQVLEVRGVSRDSWLRTRFSRLVCQDSGSIGYANEM